MGSWSLLVPKGWAGLLTLGGVFYGLLNAIRFSDTITIGSVIVAALVVIAGGVFTFRNNMRTFWRNLAEERQEQVKVLEERLIEAQTHLQEVQEQAHADVAKAAEEQRAIRHELKNELAAARQLLVAEHAKTDLTALMEQLAKQHMEAMQRMETGTERQLRILGILESLTEGRSK